MEIFSVPFRLALLPLPSLSTSIPAAWTESIIMRTEKECGKRFHHFSEIEKSELKSFKSLQPYLTGTISRYERWNSNENLFSFYANPRCIFMSIENSFLTRFHLETFRFHSCLPTFSYFALKIFWAGFQSKFPLVLSEKLRFHYFLNSNYLFQQQK